MDELRTILLAHRRKYPAMQFSDYLKIIYQNTFGPGHFGGGHSLSEIINDIEEEAEQTSRYNDDLLVDIGFDYVRVDLQVIRQGLMTAEALGKVFYQSMREVPGNDDYLSFRIGAEVLANLIDEGSIVVKGGKPSDLLSLIDFDHPKAFSHSNQYREAYQPHYRVVSKTILRENLKLSDELSI